MKKKEEKFGGFVKPLTEVINKHKKEARDKSMVSKDKFDAYITVQKSGATNMFAIKNVIQLASEICEVELTKEDCLYIMENYSILKEKYGK